MSWSMWIAGHWALIGGVAATALAVIAWIADYRRARRADLDRVGLMPWTGVFFWATMAAAVLLGWAAKVWLAG